MTSVELSVIVPSVNGYGDLHDCLDALQVLRREVELEVIVVDRLGGDLSQAVAADFPLVRFLSVDPETSIPAMRAVGFEHANGQAVGVIEDHVHVRPGWGRRIVQAFDDGMSVIGGPIENTATDCTVDWAAFLCEYSHCLPPWETEPASWLPGNNVAYRGDILAGYSDLARRGLWENAMHEAMQSDGIQLMRLADLAVDHRKHYSIREYLDVRFHYSRSFAGMRTAGQPWPKRLALGVMAFALPPLLLARIVPRVWRNRRYRPQLLRSLPLIGGFTIVWAAGEIVGYWAGGADSLARVR
jgi:hypothetical protein